MLESIKHVVNGREYEFRVVPTETRFEIRTYLQGKRITGLYAAPYDVERHFNVTAAQLTGLGAVATLIECAKSGIDRATRN